MSSESNNNEFLSRKTPEKETHRESSFSSLSSEQSSPLPGLNRFKTSPKSRPIEDKYLPPENLLEVRIVNPKTHGFQKDEIHRL